MRFMRTAVNVSLSLALIGGAGLAGGQTYPQKAIRAVTGAAGGSTDFAARLIAQGMTKDLGQPVIVDNRGGGVAAINLIVQAAPDGYSLLYYGSILWLLPLLQKAPYDTLRDFIPISLSVSSPNIMLVHPSLPVKSVKELIALAKARPGELNYGSGGLGSSGHMSVELFKYLTQTDIVRVAFKGTGPAMISLMSGEIQVVVPSSGGLEATIKSGRVRALAVTGTRRMKVYPNLPTMAEAGVPGYQYGQYSGLFAPAKTPAPIIERLAKAAIAAANDPDNKAKFARAGVDPEGSTPQEFTAHIKEEVERLGAVITKAHIRQ